MNLKSLILYTIRQRSKDLKHLIPGKWATKVLQNYKVRIYEQPLKPWNNSYERSCALTS